MLTAGKIDFEYSLAGKAVSQQHLAGYGQKCTSLHSHIHVVHGMKSTINLIEIGEQS